MRLDYFDKTESRNLIIICNVTIADLNNLILRSKKYYENKDNINLQSFIYVRMLLLQMFKVSSLPRLLCSYFQLLELTLITWFLILVLKPLKYFFKLSWSSVKITFINFFHICFSFFLSLYSKF